MVFCSSAVLVIANATIAIKAHTASAAATMMTIVRFGNRFLLFGADFGICSLLVLIAFPQFRQNEALSGN